MTHDEIKCRKLVVSHPDHNAQIVVEATAGVLGFWLSSPKGTIAICCVKSNGDMPYLGFHPDNRLMPTIAIAADPNAEFQLDTSGDVTDVKFIRFADLADLVKKGDR